MKPVNALAAPADGPGLDKAGYETLAEFRYALRRFQRFSESAAAAIGLSPRQHQALLAVKGFPGRDEITIGELAERLQVRHHSAVGLVDRLVAQGYLRRISGAEDRRQVFLGLTEQGSALLERLSAAHRDELRRIGPTLRTLLERLADRP